MIRSPHGIYCVRTAHKLLRPGTRFWTMSYYVGKGVIGIDGPLIVVRYINHPKQTLVVLCTLPRRRDTEEWYLSDLCRDTHGVFLNRRDAMLHLADCQKYARSKVGRRELYHEAQSVRRLEEAFDEWFRPFMIMR